MGMGHGGPGQHTQSEKPASACATQGGAQNATAEAAAANEDAVKDGPN